MRMTPERPKVARSRSGANAAGQWERKGARASKRKENATLKEIWWTQGQYDVVSVVEAPDEASMTALAMSLGKLGYVRTQTLRAYAAKELAPIMDKVV